MSNLSVFTFDSNDVRFVEVNGSYQIVAIDLLRASGSTTTVTALEAMIVEGLGKGLVSDQPLKTKGGIQTVLTLSEAAFTFYLSRSRTEAGKKLNRWIHTEILPSIRKTGGYSVVQQPKLSANKQALEISRDVREITDNLVDNPRLAQYLIDHAISEILPSQNTLTGSTLKGVVEMATELGFKANFKNRSKLGQFVKARCRHLAQSDKRLVNGELRDVACYPDDSEEVKQAIKEFFS